MSGQRRYALLLWLSPVALLSACTASWQAPLEDRQRTTRPAPPVRAEAPPRQRPPAPQTRRTSKPRSSGTYHRVQRGETLYSIAWRYDKDFSQLARWNGIRAPYTIFPGQVLRLKPPLRKAPAASSDTVARRPQPAKPIASKPSPKPPQTTQRNSAQRPGVLAWKWPVRGRIISKYSGRDATKNGLKLAGTIGQPVRAAEGGKVVYSGSGLIGYGRLIIIKHNERYLSAYGHNSRLLVQEGQQVERGQQIADMGSSNTGVAMLHFEIRKNGRPIDPLSVLPARR